MEQYGFYLNSANRSRGHGGLSSGTRFKPVRGSLGRRRPVGSRSRRKAPHILAGFFAF